MTIFSHALKHDKLRASSLFLNDQLFHPVQFLRNENILEFTDIEEKTNIISEILFCKETLKQMQDRDFLEFYELLKEKADIKQIIRSFFTFSYLNRKMSTCHIRHYPDQMPS